MLGDIALALGQLGDRRFLAAVLKALAITIALLAATSWAIGTVLGFFLPEVVTLPWIGEVSLAASWLSWAAIGLLLVGSVFLMLPVAFVCVGFFLDDVADAVEARHYPHLPQSPRLSMAETVRDAIAFLALVVLVNLLALAIYFLSNLAAPFVFWAVNGFLLGREYFQLVAARRLGRKAAAGLRRTHRMEIWATGVLMAIPLSIPIINLFVPVIGVAAYAHMVQRLGPPPGPS